MTPANDVRAVAEGVDVRLGRSVWDLSALDDESADVAQAAEVALFALKLAGQGRKARREGRFSRLVVSFAMAACIALASIACDKPDASPEATAQAIAALPDTGGAGVSISAQPRASPARFNDLVLLSTGTDQQPWATVVPKGSPDAPILVDRVGSGLDSVGSTYSLAAQPVTVGTRDGQSQFLDPLEPATATGSGDTGGTSSDQITQRWGQDERYLAATRAIAGQPTVLDAAYNAEAAATAGGTHTYTDGVVLRAEPDQPVIQVIDRGLLESGRPTRAEDVVYVATRPSEQSLYEPGQVVNLRDVVMDKQNTDVNGQATTLYVANAALDGARVEMTGNSVNLEQLLQPRLQRVDQDLSAQQQEQPSATPGTPQPSTSTGTPTPGAAGQPVIVNNNNGFRGPSFVDDFLIWMWLSNRGYYRGPTVIVNNPPSSPSRPGGDVYYSPPPAPSPSTPSTVASSQTASRSTALEAARSSVSGQASGTGGGVAATNKSASDASARVSAATTKSAAATGAIAAASAGKSTSSVASNSSGTASRSAGSTSAGSRGTAGSSSSSSSGSKSIGGSSGGFGGKGVGSSSSS